MRAEFSVICIIICFVSLCGINIIYGSVIERSINYQDNNLPIKRNPRSPLTYVADEGGQRVVIIVLQSPNSKIDNSANLDTTIVPNKIPGALQLIETLRRLGIPGLPPPTSYRSPTYLPPVPVPYTPSPTFTPFIKPTTTTTTTTTTDAVFVLSGVLPGDDQGPVGSPGFGADLSGGLVGGGFSKKEGNVEKSE